MNIYFSSSFQKLLFKFILQCLVIITPVFFSYVHAAAAGKVVFATGTSTAIDSSGVSRSLTKGDEVFSGDTLQTRSNSRLQIGMIDGAYISVQPNSQYVISEYNYSGTPDGTEKSIYRLLKGGVRAVTGLIGKSDPEAYKVRTAVATIGIRGTGHNTRICQGDCGNKKDGLYHHTWEGITYVTNDVDSVDVPAGKGVFIPDIDAPIEPLDQPSAVTAVETAKEESEKEQEDEELIVLDSVGDERDDEGLQVVVVEDDEVTAILDNPYGEPTSSTTLTGLVLQAVSPDFEVTSQDGVDAPGLFDTAIFLNSDGQPVGVLGNEDDHDGFSSILFRTFATIDINAVQGGDNAALVDEANSFLDVADPADVEFFLANPATVAEFTSAGELGFGRWSDGRLLFVDKDLDTGAFIESGVDELSGFQSIHFIFGPAPPLQPVSGYAAYDFVGGTQSTSVSGSSIGNGVLEGLIAVDFGLSTAIINMKVDHSGTFYSVSGTLDATDNLLFDTGVFASTDTVGSACNPSCGTFIDGGFAGPDSNGVATHIGIEYDIQETDVVTGVAGFKLIPDNTTNALSAIETNYVVLAVHPDATSPDQVDVFTEFDVSVFFENNEPVGAIGTEDDGFGPIRIVDTVHLANLLWSDNTSLSQEVFSLLKLADHSIVAFAGQDPASVAEFTRSGDVGFGRWSDGWVLTFEDDGTTEAEQLTGFQSAHFIFGPDPGVLPVTGSAIYNFIGGTDSTSASGTTIGIGITSGDIFVDFGTSTASITMDVDHNNSIYMISGPLNIDALENSIFDVGVSATTSTPGSVCNPSCATFIDGGFAGPDNGGIPSHIGIEYDIQETDVIMGVGLFGS